MRRTIFLILLLVLLLSDVSCWRRRRRRRRRRRYVPPAVHGGWSSWALTGSCSKTCGGGTQQRSRACTNPRPANGGSQCAGAAKSSVPCNSQDCPIRVSNAISTDGGIKYQLVSCYNNKQRRLNHLLITERDPASSAWNGIFVDWHNWKDYMDAFLDRCATKVESMNMTVFGVGYYAECWGDKSVSNALSAYPGRLRDFSKCVKQDWSACQEGTLRCIGDGGGIAVYQIVK